MKRKSMMKRMMAAMLSAVMVFGSVNVSVSAKETTAAVAEETASVELYPTPQSAVIDSEEGMKLTGTVDVVIHGEQDEATLPKLKALLEEEDITYEIKDKVGKNAAIVLGTVCDDKACTLCDSVEDSENALSHEQGYVLKSSDDSNKNGQITIIGADEDGTYYGVMSLIQLFDQKTSDGRIAEVTVSDYPDVLFRGYVEGFYGIPWSFEDRADLFRDTSLYKMTTYIYAPKDDQYHRSAWRTLYPEEEAKNIQELAAIAAENNMEFCWTIHPGSDYNYTKDSNGDGQVDDFDALIAKFEQVYSLGVRQFGIFYDDLDYSVANGTRHAGVINAAYEYMTEKYGDVKPFVTVVTRYTNSWGASMTGYFTPFMQQIHEDTLVLWTGNSTMSAVTKDYYEWPQKNTGIDRDFGVWWNYPVTDYCYGHLFMSPLDCLDNDVDNISTFFLNPMSEAEASKVAIYAGADYSWNIADFNSKESWKRAIKELVPDANESFERFADNLGYVSQGSGFFFDESVYMKEEMANFTAAMESGEGLEEEVANMKFRFEQMVSDAEILKTIENEAMLEEIDTHLNAYAALGKAGAAAMEGFEAALAGNIKQTIAKTAEMKVYLEESTSYRIKTLDGDAQACVGTYRIAPFLENMEQQIMEIFSEHYSSEGKVKMVTNVTDLEKQGVAYKNGTYSISDITAVMNKGDYVGIVLPKVVYTSQIRAAVSDTANFKLQYSLNGIEWNDIEANAADGVLTADTTKMAAYVRVLCTADQTDAVIGKLSVTPLSDTVSASADTNMTAKDDNAVSNVCDGDLTTMFCSADKVSEGDYIQVDLGTVVALYDAGIYFGDAEGFAATKLQVSLDGETWEDAGESVAQADYIEDKGLSLASLNSDGSPVRYIRFTATASGNAVKAYEVRYNETMNIMQNASLTATTDMGTYMSFNVSNAVDGNMDSKFYSSSGTSAGNYIQVDLGTNVSIYDAEIYFGGNPNKTGDVDGFASTKLEVSADGTNWTEACAAISSSDYKVSNGRYLCVLETGGVTARYVRFTAASSTNSWCQVYEIEFNGSIDSNPIRYTEGTVKISSSNYLDDGKLETAPSIQDVAEGDTLIYPMTTVTKVATIGIYQASSDACNAQVSVEKLDGTWVDLGTLDSVWKMFDVNDTILSVKFTFVGTVKPMIGEIIVEGMDQDDDADLPVIPEEAEVVRLYGADRYATGIAAADELKSVLGVDKFDTVVIATGKGYADALSGSYLAAVKNAPILLTNGKTANVAELHAYIKANVKAGATIYVLGGEAAVSEEAAAIEGYDVVRLKGGNRYETNLAILAEAGYEGQEDLLVATGKSFADSLSASAAARPILLVKPDAALTDDQKAVAANFANIYVIGGEGAVSTATAEELAAYGNVTRLSGSDRYETSVAVAEAFFTDPETVVLAYGKNYPDGLCGGALAAALNAPLILTKEGSEDAAAAYVAANGIVSGYVLGGDGVLPNDTVVTVFGLNSAEEIK